MSLKKTGKLWLLYEVGCHENLNILIVKGSQYFGSQGLVFISIALLHALLAQKLDLFQINIYTLHNFQMLQSNFKSDQTKISQEGPIISVYGFFFASNSVCSFMLSSPSLCSLAISFSERKGRHAVRRVDGLMFHTDVTQFIWRWMVHR